MITILESRLFAWVKTGTALMLILKLACSSIQPAAMQFAVAIPRAKPPEENRFTKVVLVERLEEPLELAVLEDGKVLFIELKGKLKLYNPATKTTTVAGRLNVYDQNEDGLLGLAADPDYEKNHFIYLYYSPAGTASINRLSRFVFDNDSLHLASEKVIIDIPVYRSCCHSGGSIAFGPGGNLFLSLGDDTGATKYSPIDERARKNGQPSDVQRSSANTNDLRGKILRLHIEPDGSYTIPEGNLFPKGTPGTRPEIFVMGTRNPFRISVDQKSGTLYWGEVGPDAGEDSAELGPKGHDEINRAAKPGFFGWPYFVGDNKPYRDYDFEKQVSGPLFNPAAPMNTSPNNTGLQALPPAQKAFIWYPYSDSKEFPEVGQGGRNAMAGPVFYDDMYSASEVKFPTYYNGKLFIYDWMRDWIMTVTMDENGNYKGMERFLAGTIFNKPVDMQFAKDGSLYVLEYGTYWHAQNDDARLSRIEYSEGNRKPIVKAAADKKAGAIPLTVQFSGKGSFDYDKGDQLRYDWTFDQPGRVQSRKENPVFTFSKPGIYKPVLKVTDAAGKEAILELPEILAGNDPPKVAIEVVGNRSFYWDNSTLNYRVKVTDKEDGSLEKGTIPANKVSATFSFTPYGKDIVEAAQGHQNSAMGTVHKGRNLMDANDCRACHAMDKTSVGPAFIEVANRYQKKEGSVQYLAEKIRKGGGGNWGHREMAAHPQVSAADAEEMVKYILTLSEPAAANPSAKVSLKGKLDLKQHVGQGEDGTYLLIAGYLDKGGQKIGPLSGRSELVLRHPKLYTTEVGFFKGAAKASNGNAYQVKYTEDKAYVLFKGIDLTGINRLVYEANPNTSSGRLELRLDSAEGKLLSSTDVISAASKWPKTGRWMNVPASIAPTTGLHDIYIVFRNNTSVSIWNAFYMNSVHFLK